MKPKKNRETGYLAVGLTCFIMAVSNFYNPVLVRPSGGRWDRFFAIIWDAGGASGIQAYWLFLTVVFLCIFFGEQ